MDDFTLPRWFETAEYWQRHPPLFLVIPSALGVEPQHSPTRQSLPQGGASKTHSKTAQSEPDQGKKPGGATMDASEFAAWVKMNDGMVPGIGSRP